MSARRVAAARARELLARRRSGASISVLIATRNRGQLLSQALVSLVGQTHTAWEAIVVHNGSRTISRRGIPDDLRIVHVWSSHNLGECGGRNLALARARGKYVCYLDDDDLLTPDSLASRLASLEVRPECGMVYADYRVSRLDGSHLASPAERAETPLCMQKAYYDPLVARSARDRELVSFLLRQFNFVRGGTPLIRREVVEAVGGFDEQFEAYGDYDLWLRIAARFRIAFLNEVVYVYRIHAGSTHLRAARDGREWRDAMLLCRKHRIRHSVQFAAYQSELNEMWARSAAEESEMPPAVTRTAARAADPRTSPVFA